MSNDAKGLVAVIVSVIGLWFNVFVDLFPRDLRSVLLTGRILPFIILALCIWWGYNLRKSGAKYWGLIVLVLAAIGIINILAYWAGFGHTPTLYP
jgi:hypothetical protein